MMVLAEELRNSIYQAAMQGKLTQQFETDGNVDELLSAIATDRNKLFENGIIDKPVKVSPINEEELPFDIPDSWRWVRWGVLSNSIQYGYNAPAQTNGDALMVRISDINNNEIVWANVPYCSIDESAKNKYTLFENDLLFARTGGTVGKTVLAKNVPKNTVFAGYLIRSNYNARLNPQYLKYYMESELYWKQLRNGTTQTAQPNCNGKTLSKMLIPLPPIEEQQRIVDRVNELMKQIDDLVKIEQQFISLKDSFPGDLRSAILQAAMQGKLTEQLDTDSCVDELLNAINEIRQDLINDKVYKEDKKLRPLSDDEIPFDIPENWRWIKLGYCSTYGQSKEKATEEDIKSEKWSLDLEDIEKITGRVLQKLSANKRQINGDKICFRKGEILYSKLRPYLLKILIADEDGICTPELIPFSMIGQINPRYILWVLRSPHVDYKINAVTYGVKMPRVGTDTMLNLLIPLPPVEEQERIVKRLEELLPMCEKLIDDD